MKRALVLLVLTSGLVLSLPAPAHGGHWWRGYHWKRTSEKVTVLLGDNMTSSWDGLLRTVARDWSRSSVLDVFVTAGTSNRYRCRGASGRVEVCNAPFGRNGWLGVATVWQHDGHLLQAVVKLNDTYFGSRTYNHPYIRRHVLCQEVGHTFGLAHTRGVSCMDERNGMRNAAYVDPGPHDYEQLRRIYAHEHRGRRGGGGGGLIRLSFPRFEFSSVGVVPPAPRALVVPPVLDLPVVSDPWLPESDRPGAAAVTVKRFPGGVTVIQFVVRASLVPVTIPSGPEGSVENEGAAPPRVSLLAVRSGGRPLIQLGTGADAEDGGGGLLGGLLG